MKKICTLILALACAITFAACSSGQDTQGTDKGNNNPPKSSEEDNKGNTKAYSFKYEGTEIAINMEAAPLLDKLGKEISYFEAPSCAFEGIDKIYTYGGFELHTYPSGDKEFVSAVIFLDDSVKTEEGVYIGDTKEKVLSVYGKDYKDVDGAYAYEKGEGKLQFIFKDDAVVSIEYIAVKSK